MNLLRLRPGRRGLLAGLGIALALGVGLVAAPTASAHALLISSQPAAGADLPAAPSEVVCTFGQVPDPKLSSLTVVDSSGASVTAGPTVAVPGKPLELEVPLKPLRSGVYTVTWHTISTVDGHLAAGAFAFGVGVAPGAAANRARAAVTSPPPSALAVAARVVLFAGLMLMVGIASTSLVVLGTIPGFAPLLLFIAWVVATLGAFGVEEAAREASGVSWATALTTSIGTTVLWRLVAVVAGGVATAVTLRLHGRGRRWALAAAGIAGALGMWVDVAASHAAAEDPVVVNLLLQWWHILAAGVWIGGLFALLLGVRGAPSPGRARAVRRFSTLAGVSIVVLAATGIIRAVLEIQSWSELVTSAFGQLVLVKLGLLALLTCLGAINRFTSVPRAGASLRRLRRVGSVEVVAGVAAALVAAALVNNVPPVQNIEAAAAAASPSQLPHQVTVTGSDYATTVRVRLVVAPGTAGFDQFTLTATDYDTGAPIVATQVTLTFAMPLRPDLGSSTLVLHRQRNGTYAARGANLSVAGTWSVSALIQRSTQAAQVQLQLSTVVTPPTVTEQRFANLPSLYTLQLSHGQSIQVYLDPNRPGANQFHITFMDPTTQSGEISIAQLAVGMTPPGGTLQVLSLRRLDPYGHFVADVQAPEGASRFDIIATATSGEQVDTYIDLVPGG